MVDLYRNLGILGFYKSFGLFYLPKKRMMPIEAVMFSRNADSVSLPLRKALPCAMRLSTAYALVTHYA